MRRAPSQRTKEYQAKMQRNHMKNELISEQQRVSEENVGLKARVGELEVYATKLEAKLSDLEMEKNLYEERVGEMEKAIESSDKESVQCTKCGFIEIEPVDGLTWKCPKCHVTELENMMSDVQNDEAFHRGEAKDAKTRVTELETEVKRLDAGWYEANGRALEVGLSGKAKVTELEDKLEMNEKTHRWQISEMRSRSIKITELEVYATKLEVIVRDYRGE